jgi:hypothetical protein
MITGYYLIELIFIFGREFTMRNSREIQKLQKDETRRVFGGHATFLVFCSTGHQVKKKKVLSEDDQSNNHQDQQILWGIGSSFIVGITGSCGFHGRRSPY